MINSDWRQQFLSSVDKIDPRDIKIFWLLFLLNMLSFGYASGNLTLNYDDVDQSFDHNLWWSSGRWLFGIIQNNLFENHFTPLLMNVIGVFLMICYGFVICKLWKLDDPFHKFVVIAVISTFPYMSDIYAFKAANVVYPLSFLLVALALQQSFSDRNHKILLSGILYMLSFACYQASIGLIAPIVAFQLILESIRRRDPGYLTVGVRVVLSLTTGLILYFLSLKIMFATTQFSPTDYQGGDQVGQIDITHTLAAIGQAYKSTIRFLNPSIVDAYYPMYLKTILLFVLLLTFGAFWQSRKLGSLAAFALLFLALIGVRAMQIAHPNAYYHNLMLLGYAVFCAGLLASIFASSSANWLKNIAIVCSVVLIFGFSIQNNKAAYAQVLVTNAEFHRANRILSRIEQIPQYKVIGPNRVAFVGEAFSQPLSSESPFSWSVGIGFPPMFDATRVWKMLRLLRPYKFERVVEGEAYASAIEYAKISKRWPHPDSVAYIDGTIVVVISTPMKPNK